MDHQFRQLGHSYGLKKSELRKIRKPLMERKRRERINTCLDELKSLLMEVQPKQSPKTSKIEKADILEQTVCYLKQIKTGKQDISMANVDDPISDQPLTDAEKSRFSSGFTECANEVLQYLGGIKEVDDSLCVNLKRHLSSRVGEPNRRPNHPEPDHTLPLRINIPEVSPSLSLVTNDQILVHRTSSSKTSLQRLAEIHILSLKTGSQYSRHKAHAPRDTRFHPASLRSQNGSYPSPSSASEAPDFTNTTTCSLQACHKTNNIWRPW